MINSVRSALLIGAAIVATSIGPAQAGPATEPLLISATASLPESTLVDLLDPNGETQLADQPTVAEPDPLAVIEPVKEAVEAVEPAVSAGADLTSMVSALRSSEPGSRELECLATGIYFESKSEPLTGQLAVGQVIANRSDSKGRFPSSYCGVLFQRGQFSFVRGSSLPKANRGSRQWHNAVAIAKIIDRNLKASAVGKALFFHARYVSPNWKLKRVAAIGNHVFYR